MIKNNLELAELSSAGEQPVVFKGMNREEEEKVDGSPLPNPAIPKPPGGLFAVLCCCLVKKTIPTMYVDRNIRMDGTVYPVNNVSNAIDNKKYTILSFIPIVVFNQFKFFFNMFFLLLAVSQFIPILKVGLLIGYVAPLIFVLVMNMLKEAFDDLKRFFRDKETNNTKYRKMLDSGLVDCTAAQMKVGDIIEVGANQRIPADLVLLYTNDISGTVFIRTDQLDGETDWKLRKPIPQTQALLMKKDNVRNMNSCLHCNPPSKLIYEFIGVFEADDGNKEPLDLENTMWANTVLCSGKALGLVVFTGKETRMAMNSRDGREKRGSLDEELNALTKYIFAAMVVGGVLMVMGGGSSENVIILFFKFILLTCCVIPISLRINLDFSKIVFSYRISNDPNIEGALARNSDIPEELGRIQFILSDKTGTLTQNEMIFKNLCLEQIQFKDEDLDDMRRRLKSECQKEKGPMADVFRRLAEGKSKSSKRDTDKMVRDMLTAIAVCHNVTPVEDEFGKSYQASSPDEVALVKLAESVGMILESRDQKSMRIRNIIGQVENYQILECFPFSSDTKRMGILLRHVETDKLIFYLKGADTAILSKVPEIQKGFLLDECENLAREGLRTLVITQKAITQKEYESWSQRYHLAKVSANRAVKTREVIELLENNMDFLGITGVEDKLQEDVRISIETIRNAGINFWMLTGDKIETAMCIAISTAMKTPQQDFYDIKEQMVVERELNEFGNKINSQRSQVLVIDGTSLTTVTEYNEEMFFGLASKVATVVCCRCSPTQKSYITDRIKHYTGKKTLGIGDGGNDVGMILTADVGIGIVGKEGKQAALASDFSILKFKHLTGLLLWHGRNSYKRGALMAQFVIHRGLFITIAQTYFSLFFYWVAIPFFNGVLVLGYGTVYTMIAVFSLILNEDVDYETAMKYPELYKGLLRGKELCTKSILMWTFQTTYQGFVLMIIATWAELSLLEMQTTAFSSMVFIALFNVINEMARWSKVMVATCIFSGTLYIVSILLFPWYLDVSPMGAKHYTIVGLSVFVAWLPLYLTNYVMFKYYPTEDQKLMRQVSSKRFGDSYLKIICNKLICWGKKTNTDIQKEFEMQDFN